MQREAATNRDGVGEMHTRRVTLSDGRYLIFYTFGQDTPAPTSAGGEAEAVREADMPTESEAEPVAEEERRV